ncbi:hypothetical protein HBH56_148590 [Parastagonospora nodorum]|uniref:Uncharacterized protein n=1 Tax=Phaeosphaeria nodorum (strain SN15 / ATCC MYA-4574 / FGSC 10173) TaxID=321614 RepID=A0A7U2EVZ0_PHANO|nr:hypothetical protein HBH56_148590 [Parastagonospora nodorum]QRC94120.1 hypothetical protein JI435_405190 [Parastagonospora nodorum SN15]KAH3923219.1 hypothetical protein HBH54_213230 [Parastagonospora nodorum]KAH3983749.1 hypothetical protein HBH52_063970 [Parastagonospora nodorum]KAH3985652.1 hypothetical protein HBH51_022740 [Parastagonospora nodorum]
MSSSLERFRLLHELTRRYRWMHTEVAARSVYGPSALRCFFFLWNAQLQGVHLITVWPGMDMLRGDFPHIRVYIEGLRASIL